MSHIRIGRCYSYLLVLLFLSAAMIADAQHVEVNAPSHVTVGEPFVIEYVVNSQDVRNFRLTGKLDGLEVVGGPNVAEQSSFQMVNGHMSSSSIVSYSYFVVAKKKGNIHLPVARVAVGSKTVSSTSNIVKAIGTTNNQGGNDIDSDPLQQSRRDVSPDEEVFIKATLSRNRVYEQEPILLTYKLYTRCEMSLSDNVPSLKGFYMQKIPQPKPANYHTEIVNGTQYKCVVWSQYMLYPQTTGKLEIPSLTFRAKILHESRDPMAFITGRGYNEVIRDIKTRSLSVMVDKLPAKPATFSGGVGKMNISAQLSKKDVKAGEPVSVRIVVSGNGNLKLIKQPDIVLPSGWDKYNTKVTDKTHITSNGVEGNMVYDVMTVPRKEGSFTISPISLVYYDTTSKSYKTVKTEALKVTVGKSLMGDSQVSDFSSDNDGEIKPIIPGKVHYYNPHNRFFGSSVYWCTVIILFAIFIAMLFFNYLSRRGADISLSRFRNSASKSAIKRLLKAKGLMATDDKGAFYDEVLKSLWGYVSERFNMPVSELSRDNVEEMLESHGIEDEASTKFISVVDECEFNRYSNGNDSGNMSKIFESAVMAISDIESSLKHNKRSRKFGVFLLALVAFMSYSNDCLAVSKANADAEYDKGNYVQAIKDYNELLENGESYELYFNLGNAYFKTDNIPQAIIAYERALKLSPGSVNASHNLNIARAKTIDKIVPNTEIFVESWYSAISGVMSIDGWAFMSIICLVLAMGFSVAYLVSRRLSLRYVGFWGACIMMFIFVLSIVFAFHQQSVQNDNTGAVVIAPSVSVKSSASSSSKDKFMIHEGTKVNITDTSISGWISIVLADGREGWIETSVVEEI